MSFVYVANDSGAMIEVAVASVTNINGMRDFYRVGPGETMKWSRAGNEVVHVNRLKGDNALETYVGILDCTLIIHALPQAMKKELVFVTTDVVNRPASFVSRQCTCGAAQAFTLA
jgi:hypothetical protein